jgi:hypothetical protein
VTRLDHKPTSKGPSIRTSSLFRRFPAAVGLVVLLLAAAVLLSVRPAAAASMLGPGQTLGPGQELASPGGQYLLRMQGDGNLVLYGPGHTARWSSRTNGTPGAYVVRQTDGNLVVYAPGGAPKFATGTNGNPGTDLEVQDDGNTVLYAPGHRPIWASASKAEAAISWFYARLGSAAYEGRCELAVENAFGTSGQYSTARANWNARNQQQPHTAGPRGALVFYSTSAAGHVTISLGNGQVISTSSPGGKIGISPITSWFQNPLGWAWAPW